MSEGLAIDIQKIYKGEDIQEFKLNWQKIQDLTEEILYQSRVRELAKKGFIRIATKNVHWEIPPKLPGKPLSEYVKEIRE